MSAKTEQPTARRLRKAREQGDSPVSGALSQAAAFLIVLSLAPAAVAACAARAKDWFLIALDGGVRAFSASALAVDIVMLTLPILAGGALAALVTGMIQSGGIIAWNKVAPDLARLDPIVGLRNLFNAQRLFAVARALIAALLVSWLAFDLLVERAAALANTAGNTRAAAALAEQAARRLGWLAAGVGLALAALDVLVTRHGWLKRHRMTKDEVRREHREAEGDPEVKAHRRRAHQEMLNSASIAAVRQATLLIVNPTHFATALRYVEDEDEAPRVLSQGRGELARKMIEAAHTYGVPVVRDVPVARALAELEVGDQIPEALYEAVAEILRTVWENQEQ
jgi:flagellar biosynthesis protein FlhB